MQNGIVQDPTGLIYKNATVEDEALNEESDEPESVLPNIDGDETAEAVSGVPAWIWLLVGAGIMYLKQKGESFKVVSLDEVEYKILEYARLKKGIKSLFNHGLDEVYDGVFVGTFEVTSCLRENQGGYSNGDIIAVRYQRNKGVRNFSKTTFDVRKPKFIYPSEQEKPVQPSASTDNGMIGKLRDYVAHKTPAPQPQPESKRIS